MTGVVTFTLVAIAGCAFLIYFMFALWRDSRNSCLGQRVEIRKLPSRRDKGKLLYLYSADSLGARQQRRATYSDEHRDCGSACSFVLLR